MNKCIYHYLLIFSSLLLFACVNRDKSDSEDSTELPQIDDTTDVESDTLAPIWSYDAVADCSSRSTAPTTWPREWVRLVRENTWQLLRLHWRKLRGLIMCLLILKRATTPALGCTIGCISKKRSEYDIRLNVAVSGDAHWRGGTAAWAWACATEFHSINLRNWCNSLYSVGKIHARHDP